MTRKKPVLMKMTAFIISMTMMLGMGLSVNLPDLLRPDTAITASAASKVSFSESRKMTDILNDTTESEAKIRDALSSVSEATTLYEEYGYSAFYTKNLESNFIILYNPAHVDMRAVVTTANGQKWAENYSAYLTTLAQLTGTERENMVAVFNMDIPTNLPGSSHGQWFHVSHSFAFAAICGILNNKNIWALLHETSHCFSCSGIGFDHTLFNSGEDVYANLRMLCAYHYLNKDCSKDLLLDYNDRFNRTDSTLDDKYKNLEQFKLKDEQYDKYFPEGSVWWTDKYANYKTLAAGTLHQFMEATSCLDSSYPYHFFHRLNNVLNTVTEKPMCFCYSNNPADCNNWMNTDAIEANWATISNDEWLRLYALCIGIPENAGLTKDGDKVLALYQDYLSKFTEKIRYRIGEKYYTIKVTPQILQWLRTYCPRGEDGAYDGSGSLIQALAMYEFMNADPETITVFYWDKDFKASEATAVEFYKNMMAEIGGRGFVLTATDPAITKSPKDVTAAIGQSAVFEVKASGENLTYQWQYQESGKWKDSTASGSKTAKLSVTAKATLDGIPYRCIVTDSNGEFEVSNPAVLHIGVGFTKQPENASVLAGQNAVFTVEATGSGTLTYQWQYNDGSGWKDSTVSGSKTAKISVAAKSTYDGLQYRCVVTSSNGESQISNTATLHIGVNITKQPENASVEIGKSAVFTVEATGIGTLSYQWQYLESGKWKDSTASGCNTAKLSATVKSTYDGLQYRCIVTASNGELKISDPATLHVAVSITKQPSGATVAVGQNAVFTVEAAGAGTLTYQWQYNEGNGWKDSTASGNKTAKLSATVKSTYDGLQYRCIVTSSNGKSKTSDPATLHVGVTITKQPENASVTVGKNAVFTVEATGAGTLAYQWQYNDGSGWKDSTVSGSKTAKISVAEKSTYDDLQYRCIVKSSNGLSATSKTALIKILRPQGDVNADGICNIADAVMLQKWLLCSGSLTDSEAADMNGDKKINAVDLTLLKRKLLAD